MAMRADEMIDRRRLRRKLTFWRAAAILIAAAAIVAAAGWSARERFGGSASPHIAKVRIEGAITQNDDLLKRLEEIGKSDAVKGVILAIDSPGGTTVGGEATFEAVRKVAARKPVVAEVGTLAASAGYMIATAADHIVARQTSIVGSIGVLVEFPDLTGLMDKLGIKDESIKSSPLKAEPSPFNPTTEEERAMMRAMILDSYDWFIGLVTERRPLDRAQVQHLADGSVFTGRQALGNKLVDELGGEDQAKAWLVGKGVGKDLQVIEWKPRDGRGSFLFADAADLVLRAAGLSGLAERLLGPGGPIFVDGLMSVWQPARKGIAD